VASFHINTYQTNSRKLKLNVLVQRLLSCTLCFWVFTKKTLNKQRIRSWFNFSENKISFHPT